MKRFLICASLVAIVLCGFNSCDESASGTATYYGKIINEYTDEPLEGASIKVTNGDKIHATTTTGEDGNFSIEVRLAEIDESYYILIGGKRTKSKKVEFPAFGNGSYDVGMIIVKGPTTTPIVETTLVRVDSKSLIFCEGTVVDNGEAAVTERGICWGTSTPTIKNGKIECGEGKGGFSCQIEDIMDVHERNYYVRAYATNSYGTSYGETVMIDHRNPYNLPLVDDKATMYMVLPYDLDNASYYSGYSPYKLCSILVAYDYDDWELPTLAVLQLVYQHKDSIGGFTNNLYWSSSNSSSGYYYYTVNFANGTVVSLYYDKYAEVRPVRKY